MDVAMHDAAAAAGPVALRAAHLADYQALFNRVSLHLPYDTKVLEQPTDERVEQVRLSAPQEAAPDLALAVLLFQYGRYLLIALCAAVFIYVVFRHGFDLLLPAGLQPIRVTVQLEPARGARVEQSFSWEAATGGPQQRARVPAVE